MGNFLFFNFTTKVYNEHVLLVEGGKLFKIKLVY